MQVSTAAPLIINIDPLSHDGSEFLNPRSHTWSISAITTICKPEFDISVAIALPLCAMLYQENLWQRGGEECLREFGSLLVSSSSSAEFLARPQRMSSFGSHAGGFGRGPGFTNSWMSRSLCFIQRLAQESEKRLRLI